MSAVQLVFLFAATVAGSGIAEFRGAAKLADSIDDPNERLLVYANNGNDIGLLTRHGILPLKLETRLTVSGGCCDHRATPSLSHDGHRIAYVHLAAPQPRRESVRIFDTESQTDKEVFQAQTIWAISWASDDNRLAVVAETSAEQEQDVLIVDLRSGSFKQLSHGNIDLDGRKYSISNHVPPSWSSTGKELAIEMRNVNAQTEDSTSAVIVVWDIETNVFRKLNDGVAPSWSPNDDRIAFLDSSRQSFTVKAIGSDKLVRFSFVKLKRAPLFYPIVWSPDGNKLIFQQWVDADLITDAYELDLKTGKHRFLARTELQVVNWRSGKLTSASSRHSSSLSPSSPYSQ